MRFFKGFFAVALLLFPVLPARAAQPPSVPSPSPSPQPPPALRMLMPNASSQFQRELSALLAEYNKAHPEAPVEAIRRGEGYSSLRDFIALHLAGLTPDIVVIECGELPAVLPLGLLKPVPESLRPLTRKVLEAAPGTPPVLLPFQRTVPLLFADREFLAATGGSLPRSWPELTALLRASAERLTAQPGGWADRSAIALPLQGAAGLWMLEALTGQPLWNREEGGLRADRRLLEPLRALQELMNHPRWVSADEGSELALQSFLSRRIPLLAAGSELLPAIESQAGFPWIAGPLPPVVGDAKQALEGGSNLGITRDTPEVRRFLDYLYSPAVISRWARAGGFLPPKALPAPARASRSETLLRSLEARRPRSSDPDVVRVRSAWIQALQRLFGERSRREAPDAVLMQLDQIVGKP